MINALLCSIWLGKDKPKEKDAKVKNYMNSIS